GREIAIGVVSAVVLACLGLGWNWLSSGGLVRFLGGATPADVEGIVNRLATSGIAASAALAINRTELPDGAVIAFDRPGGCPEGWEPEDAAVGSAIVGVGATRIDATGEPLVGTEYGFGNTGRRQQNAFGTPHTRGHAAPVIFKGRENDSEPISEFVY